LRLRKFASRIESSHSFKLTDLIRNLWPITVGARPIDTSQEILNHINVKTAPQRPADYILQSAGLDASNRKKVAIAHPDYSA